jgi:hypothetical protein
MQSLTRKFGLWALLLLSLSLVSLSACGDEDDGGGIQGGDSGRLSVTPLNVTFSRIELTSTGTQEVIVRNLHESEPLTLLDIQMTAREGGVADDLVLKNVPEKDFVLEAGEQTSMTVEFTARGTANAAVIEIVNSDPSYTREDPYTLDVDTLANRPQIAVDPQVVRFPRLPPGERADQTLTVRNYGAAPLIIHEAGYSGGADFSIDDLPDSEIVLDPYDAALAEENPDRYELAVTVRYSPRGDGGDTGEIRIESNDTRGETSSDGRGVTIVDVQANAQSACILVDGTTRHFGQVPIGATTIDPVSVTNCGSETLSISGIEISENTSDNEFALDLVSWDANSDNQLDAPVNISPGDSEIFRIEYGPIQVGSDTGKALIASNDPTQPSLELQLVGRGSDGQCPEANIAAKVRGAGSSPRPTVSAAPLDYIVLDGSSSDDPDGRVVDYTWTPLQLPDGLSGLLGPTAEDPGDTDASKREFRALVTGTYKYGLEVKDNEGFVSCNQAVATIVATPNEKLHIELTWTNPEDPDESDDSGSDVDVHLVKMGPGKWFDPTYDIYFNNPNSGAGGGTGLWSPESPSLDIDDTDGAGPENIQMDDPSNCEWYAVGVHYYRQLFGTAYATLRIYANENLIYEQLNTPLKTGGQFWDVARIHWNQGQAIIQDVNEVMPISPRDEPTVTEDMTDSGLCTSAALY